MKQTFEGYQIGTKVYAVSTHLKEGEDTHHYGVFPAVVDSVTFSHGSVEYWLKTPKGDDWGDVVKEELISDSFEELCQRLKVIWDKHANTF